MRLGGLFARVIEPDVLAQSMQSARVWPGPLFTRFFEADQFDAARADTSAVGALSAPAACALCDVAVTQGAELGGVEVAEEAAAEFPTRFLELTAVALGSDVAAQQLFDGGVLGRLGNGHHFMGSLPLRIIARELTAERCAQARLMLRGSADEALLGLLEEAARRAQNDAEALLVLVPRWVPTGDVQDEQDEVAPGRRAQREAPAIDALTLLGAAVTSRAREVLLVVGQPVTLEGPFGARAVDERRLLPEDTQRATYSFLTDTQIAAFEAEHQLITSFGVTGLGRFRLTASIERGTVTASLRVLGSTPRPPEEVLGEEVRARLASLERGLVVVGGPPGSGRSTTLATVGLGLSGRGIAWLSLEEPLGLLVRGSGSAARQVDLGEDQSLAKFTKTARLSSTRAVLIDVVDDEQGLDLALDVASEGRLAVCVMRGMSASAMVHRLAALDARWARRRVSEHLEAVLCRRLVPNARGEAFVSFVELVAPTEGLRRHLRAQESPAPPVLLETQGPSLDEALRGAVERGEVTRAAARLAAVDSRAWEPLGLT